MFYLFLLAVHLLVPLEDLLLLGGPVCLGLELLPDIIGDEVAGLHLGLELERVLGRHPVPSQLGLLALELGGPVLVQVDLDHVPGGLHLHPHLPSLILRSRSLRGRGLILKKRRNSVNVR